MTEKRPKSEAGENLEEMTFEAALKRLEEIVGDLESGKFSLEESLSKFEEGMRLSRLCQQKLKGVELKIEKLVAENGKLTARILDEGG